jgi:hypothetical protein
VAVSSYTFKTLNIMRNILLLGFLSLIICSCQKEKTQDRRTENPQSDSTTLAMYIDLDTTQVSGSDTIEVQKYKYDNSKRLLESDYIEYNGNAPDGITITKLFYNGTDTLPFKKTESYYELPSGNLVNTPDTGYYFYSQGRVISDSIISHSNSSSYFVRKFSYNNNKITESIAENTTPPSTYLHLFYQTKNNGNTSLQIDSTFYNGNNIGGTQTFSFSYDTKNNPFYNMPQSFIERGDPYYNMETYSEEMIFEKNNPTEIKEEAFHLKYVYEYNINNFPSVAKIYDDPDNDPTYYYKRVFIYTKL